MFVLDCFAKNIPYKTISKSSGISVNTLGSMRNKLNNSSSLEEFLPQKKGTKFVLEKNHINFID